MVRKDVGLRPNIYTVFADFQRQKSGHQKKFDQGLGTKRRFNFLQMNLKNFSHEIGRGEPTSFNDEKFFQQKRQRNHENTR